MNVSSGGADAGQATLELALCLPLVALLLATIVELGFVAADHARVWHAAREAARVAAVEDSEDEVVEAASAGGLEPLAVSIEPEPHYRVMGEPVTVTVVHRPSGRLPIIRRAVGHLRIVASVTMRIEQP